MERDRARPCWKCPKPKVPGQGQKYCAEHQAAALAERDARRHERRQLPCQYPGCDEPKLPGQGYRYCAKHSLNSYAREVAKAGTRHRTRRSGLSEEQYQAMVARQDGLCALCGQPPGRRQLSVDHDHGCCPGRDSCGKCLRGLLCDRCNPLLGYAHDDIAILTAAIAYLERWNRPISRSPRQGHTS